MNATPQSAQPLDAERRRAEFIDAMSRVASTVNIVTTDGPAGRAGLTVTAMSSVSADAEHPSLLVCLNRESSACRPLQDNGVFCVNVLRQDQAVLSDIFSGRRVTENGDRFSAVHCTTGATGAPRLSVALAAFDCRVADATLIGSHYVIIGDVVDITSDAIGAPLLYLNRGYAAPALAAEAA